MPSERVIFPLRLPDALRQRAQSRAAELGLSLNALVAVALDGYLGAPVVVEKPSLAAVGGAQPSRNAPCPCGSGKKFKRCCASRKG